MKTNVSRIWLPEGRYTWTKSKLQDFLHELDMRLNAANCFIDITRTAGVISLIEYFADVGRTQKVAQKSIGYTSGKITSYVHIFYNADNTEDSRVTHTITRDVNGDITNCDAVFSTTEDPKT